MGGGGGGVVDITGTFSFMPRTMKCDNDLSPLDQRGVREMSLFCGQLSNVDINLTRVPGMRLGGRK